MPRMINDKCNLCGKCIKVCPLNCIEKGVIYKIDETVCNDCMACVEVCPQGAIVAYIEPIEIPEDSEII